MCLQADMTNSIKRRRKTWVTLKGLYNTSEMKQRMRRGSNLNEMTNRLNAEGYHVSYQNNNKQELHLSVCARDDGDW